MIATTHARNHIGRLQQVLFALLVAIACSLMLLNSGQALAVAPANSVIGNQASATYVDSTSTTRTSTSNTVQTTVAQVKSFTLTQSGAKTVPNNQQVCYPHTITNTGNGQDTYSLTAPATGGSFAHTSLAYYLDADQNGQPDNGTAITSTGPLNSGSSFNFVVCGITSSSAAATSTGTITTTATDTNSPTANTASQTDTTTIGNASINVQKKLSSVAPPGYTPVSSGPSPNGNAGNTNPVLFVILDYTNAGTIAANNLQITDVLPSGWLYVPNSGRWTGSGATVLPDNGTSPPAGISYSAPTTAVSGTVQATIANVAGSTSGSLYFQITIAPNLAVTTAGNQAVTTNQATYQYSYTYMASTVNVPSSPTNSVLYSVLQAASVAANGSSTTTGLTDNDPLTVASASPGQTITFNNYIWNKGNAADSFDVIIRDGTSAAAYPLNALPLNGSTCNPSSVATDACTFPTGTTFQILASNGATTLLDSNGNGTPDTGTIPLPSAGVCPAPYVIDATNTYCGYLVVVKATLPVGASAGNNGGAGYKISLEARSKFDSAKLDTVVDSLTTISANSVDITNNAAIGSGGVLGTGAGTTSVIVTNTVTPATASSTKTTFTLYVNNTGATAAIYNLSSNFVSVPGGAGLSNPPAGWTITFKDSGNGTDCTGTLGSAVTSTGTTPVAAGSAKLVCAEVTIPATNANSMGTATYAPPGNYVIDFTATNQANGTVTDFIRDQVTLNPLHQVTITPNGAQNTVPGGAVTYTHTITNNGNVAETVTFASGFLADSQVPTYAWNSTAYVDDGDGMLVVGTDIQITTAVSFSLAPNQTKTLFVRVSAPMMAGSPPDITTVTATYNSGANTAAASDTTTLTAGLKLDKYQQLPGGTGSCTGGSPSVTLTSGVPNAPWSNMAISASANTVPGKCIAYLVVGTNTTGSNITSVNLTDVVPANTILETGCGAPTATAPLSVTGGPYSSGFTGTVSATAATLTPGQTFTLQFCVKIN
jgi:uncharacterized repeat protein (TIGR01451 family)